MQKQERLREIPTYELPAIGRPAEQPMLRKIALEEHFNFSGVDDSANANVSLQRIVRAMDHNKVWFEVVGRKLEDFGDQR